MAGTLGSRFWLSSAGILGLALLLSGSYCSWRNYHVPGGLPGSPNQTAIGPVSAFASVFVNGTEFADGAASVTINGVAATESQLAVGQVATVSGTTGSSGSGSASSIALTTKLLGPVFAIDLAAGTVTVLGQTVRITGDTSVGGTIAPTDVGGLVPGSLVAVDGYRTSTGLIAARFDLATLNQAYRVSGPVSNLNLAAQTFTLGGTTVDFSAVSGGLAIGIANGSYVIASGVSLTNAVTLRASQLTAQAEVPAGGNGTAGSVHGAITRFGSVADFDVGGQSVATTASTAYLGGLGSDLGPDVEVEVSGLYGQSGVLTASSVMLLPAANVRVVGTVDTLDAAGRTLTIAGIALAATAATRWDDRSATMLRTFGFASLHTGDWVEVRGVPASGTRTATARVIERRPQPPTPLVELQDVASNLSAPQFTLTGVSVDSSLATFTDVNGQGLTLASFYAQAAGRVVRARGTLSSAGALIATTVALRD